MFSLYVFLAGEIEFRLVFQDETAMWACAEGLEESDTLSRAVAQKLWDGEWHNYGGTTYGKAYGL